MKVNKAFFLKNSLVAIILLLIGFNLSYSLINCWDFVTDDAFISWRYAEQLAQGNGLLWTANKLPVEGYSNFTWILLAYLVIKLGLPLIPSLKVVATGCLLLAFFLLYRCARLFGSPFYALLSVYLFSCYKGLYWWTVSGLETSLFIMLVLLFTFLLLQLFSDTKQNNRGSCFWLCISLTLLSLTRFEGILWLVFAGLYIICPWFHAGDAREKLWKPTLKPAAICFILGFLLPYSIYFVWRLTYFGQWLPNSYLCKWMSSFYPSIASYYRFFLIQDYLAISFPSLIIGLPYLMARYDCRHLLLWLPSLAYALLLWDANPVIAHYNRLFLPAFALVCILPPLGINESLHYFSISNRYKQLICLLAILLLAFSSIPSIKSEQIQSELGHYQQRSALRLKVSQLINQHAKKNARILVSDCGVIPYFGRSDLEFIDSECLNNRDMTQYNSLELYAVNLMQNARPDWIIYSVNELGRANDLMEILMAKGFLNHYHLVGVFPLYATRTNGQRFADFTYRVYRCLPDYCKY
ncbi:protein LphB [Legionella quinlivanii]|uniref:Protein LphB n=1 Tax=Legionella quinlivanii TaxID=45073 RepID=A0A0W0Y0K1_9GAMM|nr:protein LphB [Legionella quinlivanii]SEF43462.1 hypothetical protein SAMN02746093_00178 [Legionella quinlivanii DSM 21216]STY11925.1 protein LphB [Legionella quinlivanii]